MVPHDAETGEVIEESPPATASAATTAPSPQSHAEDGGAVPDEGDDEAEYDRLQQLVDRMEDAAAQGTRALKDLWLTFSSADRAKLEGAKNRLKAVAEAADRGG